MICDFVFGEGTGCYFSDEPPVEKTFEVIEGEGWRLGYETAPESEDSFCAIVRFGAMNHCIVAELIISSAFLQWDMDFCTLLVPWILRR